MCNEKGIPATRVIFPLLLLSYPFAGHFGTISGRLWPALLFLLVLLQAPLWRRPSRVLRWAAFAVSVLLFVVLSFTPLRQEQLLYLMPPAILLPLWLVFARTLLPGRTPLVTRIAELMHDSLSPRLRSYTRAVTWVWAVFLGALLFEVVWLALYAEAEVWSLYTNFINYLLVAGFFLLEFGLRRFVLEPTERLGFIPFFRALARIDFQALSRQ